MPNLEIKTRKINIPAKILLRRLQNFCKFKVWLNESWFVIHDNVFAFDDRIICYREPDHDKVKNQRKDIHGLINECVTFK